MMGSSDAIIDAIVMKDKRWMSASIPTGERTLSPTV